MLKKGYSIIILFLLITFIWISCAGIKVPKFTKKTGIYIETDIKPAAKFEEARIKSVSVLKFDSKNVKSVGGEIIDYIDLSNRFTDDLIKRFYEIGKVDVALGEYEDRVVETDTLEKKRGDLEVQGNILERSIEFKCAPFKKIQSILGGRVNKFQEGEEWDKSFIDITLKLTDTYTGAVYWVTDMRGYIKDVVETIAKSISDGKYTEPIPVKKVTKTEKKKEEVTEEKKEK
ncbi:MAG: hypothetical protein JW827_08690 [Spirochaetes bacterium]|nr:hypothetical protein [Spirochaetota bacterium]